MLTSVVGVREAGLSRPQADSGPLRVLERLCPLDLLTVSTYHSGERNLVQLRRLHLCQPSVKISPRNSEDDGPKAQPREGLPFGDFHLGLCPAAG